MHGIELAAIFTTLIAFLLIGGSVLRFATGPERRRLLIIFLVMLPMCPLAFFLIRQPFDHALSRSGASARLLEVLQLFYAPLTEEPAKLWILLLPFAGAATIQGWPKLRLAFTIGLGFGLGEIWVLHYFLQQNKKLAALPWYQFTGFINERFTVCLFHGLFAAAALWAWRKSRLLAVILAMALHGFANLPIFLAKNDTFHLGLAHWSFILALWLPLFFVFLGFLVAILYGFRWAQLKTFPEATVLCPSCGHTYARGSIPTFNLLVRRRFFGFNHAYSRCPTCENGHWDGVAEAGHSFPEQNPSELG